MFISRNGFLFVCLFVFFFSPNLKYFELLRKKSQNFDFFSRKTQFFALFRQKFEKNLIRLQNKKSVPRYIFLRDFPEIWAF